MTKNRNAELQIENKTCNIVLIDIFRTGNLTNKTYHTNVTMTEVANRPTKSTNWYAINAD